MVPSILFVMWGGAAAYRQAADDKKRSSALLYVEIFARRDDSRGAGVYACSGSPDPLRRFSARFRLRLAALCHAGHLEDQALTSPRSESQSTATRAPTPPHAARLGKGSRAADILSGNRRNRWPIGPPAAPAQQKRDPRFPKCP